MLGTKELKVQCERQTLNTLLHKQLLNYNQQYTL